MTIAAWLMALVGPLVIKALIALSFTAITYTGVNALVQTLLVSAQSSWSSMPANVLALATLSGIPQGLGVVFGAYMAVFALKSAAGFKKYVVKSS